MYQYIVNSLVVVTLSILTLVTWASPQAPVIVIKVESIHENNTIMARPYVAPFLNLSVETGPQLIKGDILNCKQDVTHKHYGDHEDAFVALDCGNTRLVLHGVFFTN